MTRLAEPGAFPITHVRVNVQRMSNVQATPQRRRSRLTSQGQITVPKAVRDALGARPGDDLEFVPRGGGFVVTVHPRKGVLDFAGVAAGAAGRIPATAEELDSAVAQGMAEAAIARATGMPRRRSAGAERR